MPAETAPAPASRKGLWVAAAIVAAFLLLAGGAVYGLIMLSAPGESGGSSSDQFAEGGGDYYSDAEKLRLKEAERRRQQGGGDAGGSSISEEDRRKAADEKARQAALEAKKRKEKDEADRVKAKQERLKKAEDQKKENVRKLLLAGHGALTAKQFDKAVQSFEQVKKLVPDNEEAKKGLLEVQKARQRWEEEQRQAQFTKLVTAGKDHFAKRSFHKAVEDLEHAVKIKPGDAAVQEALNKAKEEKAKQDKEVEKYLVHLRRALKAKRFAEAGRALAQASKVAADHPAVVRGKLDLEAEKNRLKAEAEAKKRNRTEAQAQMKIGRDALKAKRYAEAFQAFSRVVQLAPTDAVARALLQQAKDGLNRENRQKAAPLIDKGKKAYAKKRYEEAVAALTEASRLITLDRATQTLLKKALAEVAKIREAEAAERKKQAEAQRAELIRKLIADTRTALKKKDLDAANRFVQQLSQLAPADPDVIGLKKELQKLLDARAAELKKKQAEQEKKNRLALYDARMMAGKNLVDANKFPEAIKLFKEALKLAQDDKDKDRVKKAETAIKDAEKAREEYANRKIKP
jgi:tetratricopeptide (TPR) repeat protein